MSDNFDQNKAELMMLIGALIDIAEGNNSPYVSNQIKIIEDKIEQILL